MSAPAVPARRRRTVLLGGLLLAVLLILAPAAHAQSYTVRTLHFTVIIGPAGAQRQCNVVGDLYRPADATAAHPDPAVLTTNGFGGSGCPIELDDPNYDGLAASQLITFLGGGLAATDGDQGRLRRPRRGGPRRSPPRLRPPRGHDRGLLRR